MSIPDRPDADIYTNPAMSNRKSPLIEAANAAKVKGASIGGFITLLSGVGLITASQAGALNLALAIVLGAIPVAAIVITNLTTAWETVRKAWPRVTPVDDAVKLIEGRPVRLVPAIDTAQPGSAQPPFPGQ